MRKCTEKDRSTLNEYLYRRPALNLFFIGDIENFGFASDFQSVFVGEDAAGINAVYLVYRSNLCLLSYEGKTDQDFADRLVADYAIRCISGEQSLVEKYSFPDFTIHEDCLFAEMRQKNEWLDTSAVTRLTAADIPAILSLRDRCFRVAAGDDSASLRSMFESHTGREYGIFADGKLVSIAGSTAECRGLAMAVGVCTDKDYRNRHYASKCIARLSNDLLAEHKVPCLFYNDPIAAKIYKTLGYQDIGRWAMRQKPAE